MNKNYLFIGGVPRSGTSAFTRLIGAHGKIVLGMERYKYLFRPGKIDHLTEELFSREMFFDFSDGLTNLTPEIERYQTYYDRLANKFDNAIYFGDKTPDSYKYIPYLFTNFPGAKYLFIIRNAFHVAYSWDQRAKNLQDIWGSSMGAHRSVEYWNNSLQICKENAAAFPGQFLAIDYNRIFSGATEDSSLPSYLCEFLGLEMDKSIMAATSRIRKRYHEIVSKVDRELDKNTTCFIAETADFKTYREIFGYDLDVNN